MKAVTMERGKLALVDLPDLKPGPGEVLVKSIACGICGSDLHAARHTDDFVKTSREAGGAFKLTTYNPVVLGHEFCAEVVEYGADTGGKIAAGELVCSVPVLLRDPFISVGYSDIAPGGFSEYMLLSESMLIPVPHGTPADLAAMTEPMAVGFHAVNKARLDGREAVLVIGCGPVGLMVITTLKAQGAGPIVAADYSPGRRQLAEKIGAHVVVDPAVESPYKVPELKQGEETVIFECVGVPGLIDEVFLGAPQNARIVIVGVCLQTDHFRPLIAINKELNLQFVLGYSVEEFKSSLRQIADGGFDVAPLVTSSTGLDGVEAAFEKLYSPNTEAKVLVKPWE